MLSRRRRAKNGFFASVRLVIAVKEYALKGKSATIVNRLASVTENLYRVRNLHEAEIIELCAGWLGEAAWLIHGRIRAIEPGWLGCLKQRW
jgi:hypothetical protein